MSKNKCNFNLLKDSLTKEQFKSMSTEEVYFSYWLQELKEKKIITKYEFEPKTFELYKESYIQNEKILACTYTPDFSIEWNTKSRSKDVLPIIKALSCDIIDSICEKSTILVRDKNTSYIEIKPIRDSHGSINTTNIKIKWLLQTQDIYVQMVKVSGKRRGLFKDTFTPKQFLIEKTRVKVSEGQSPYLKEVHWTPIDINEYIKKNKEKEK